MPASPRIAAIAAPRIAAIAALRIAAVAALGCLMLAGCSSGGTSGGNPSSGSPAGGAPSPSASAAPSTSSAPASPESSAPASPESSAPTPTSGPGAVQVGVGGQTISVAPTEVSCSGRPGALRNLVAKGPSGLPQVTVQQNRTVMVKVDRRAEPFTTKAPKGMKVESDGVRFDHARAGAVTINGKLVCTRWQG